MNFVLQTPSLQHLAGVKIVAALWNQRNVFINIPHSFDDALIDKAPQMRKLLTDKVISKVSALELPERSKKQLVNLVYPLGTEIIDWCRYYDVENGDIIQAVNTLLPFQLCWTMHGTIDYAKTAELMTKDERVDLQRRFEVACISCLEDEARVLFQRLAEERGQELVSILRYVKRCDLCELILFFTRSINLDVRDESIISGTEHLFEIELRGGGNRAMCEYLFERLSQREREQVFEECQQLIGGPSRNLLYYLSRMSEEQRRHLFSDYILRLLEYFLHWPMQSLFKEAVECGWLLTSELVCSRVLFTIAQKINQGSNDYDYAQLFWECWGLIPADYKQFHLDCFMSVVGLLHTQREEFLVLILNGASSPCISALCNRYEQLVSQVLMDERCISDAALMECKETAEMESSNDKEDEEKRLRSQYVSRLVDLAMESRVQMREYHEDSSDILRNVQQIVRSTAFEYLQIN